MNYQWGIIGAGPAGIAAVGKLIDFGISPKEIVWVDPAFKVGDLGTLWQNVPSNTKVELFLRFLNAAKAFDYSTCKEDFALHHIDPEKTCRLGLAAEPLQWVTNHLRTNVMAIEDKVSELMMESRAWKMLFHQRDPIVAKNVILALGAEPKDLYFPAITKIPVQDAMDPERINKQLSEEDTVAVFGSSHSAILVLKNLVEHKVNKIINFYRSPLKYAVYLDDWILFDDTGLKGIAAEWARHHLDDKLPQNLQRVYSNNDHIAHYLPQCNKAVYAVGFERRLLPIKSLGPLEYIEQCGIIAPGLFGLGIAFPEAKLNPLGILEYRVGLWKFMDYLQQILPIWLKYTA